MCVCGLCFPLFREIDNCALINRPMHPTHKYNSSKVLLVLMVCVVPVVWVVVCVG